MKIPKVLLPFAVAAYCVVAVFVFALTGKVI